MSSTWFLDSLVAERRRSDLRDGLIAAIRLYYDNNTDSTEIDQPMLTAMETIVEYTGAYDDVEALVSEVELEINGEGGVRSNTDGVRHRVASFPGELVDA